jgi:hypothetical protein
MMWLAPLLMSSITTTPSESMFEQPFRLSDSHGVIDVDQGEAAPLFVDFDGDGLRDLLVGQFEGRLRIYKNIGTAQAPKFDGFTWFQAGGKDARVPCG